MSQMIHADDGSFEAEVMQAQVPVLVDFSATWCGPCKKLEPVLQDIAGDYANRVKVVKVDIDKAPKTAARFNVLSVPTMLVFSRGQVRDQVVGLVAKRAIADRLDKVI